MKIHMLPTDSENLCRVRKELTDDGRTVVKFQQFTGELVLPDDVQLGDITEMKNDLTVGLPETTKGNSHENEADNSGLCSPNSFNIPTSFIPEPRWGTTLSKASDQRVLLYGGVGVGQKILGDMSEFDTIYKKWCSLSSPGISLAWHSATFLKQSGHLIIFGGLAENGVSNNALVFDCDINLWYPLTTSGSGPSPRMGHSATLVGNRIFIFGGKSGRNEYNDLHILNTLSWRWSKPVIVGRAPKPRVFHRAVNISSSESDTCERIAIIGGRTGNTAMNDIFILTHTYSSSNDKSGLGDTYTWTKVNLNGKPFEPRCGHAAIPIDGNIIVFGGWDPQRNVSHSDTLSIDLDKSSCTDAAEKVRYLYSLYVYAKT